MECIIAGTSVTVPDDCIEVAFIMESGDAAIIINVKDGKVTSTETRELYDDENHNMNLGVKE